MPWSRMSADMGGNNWKQGVVDKQRASGLTLRSLLAQALLKHRRSLILRYRRLHGLDGRRVLWTCGSQSQSCAGDGKAATHPTAAFDALVGMTGSTPYRHHRLQKPEEGSGMMRC
jgi:hypothetical protein